MKCQAGIWIDHKNAVVVLITADAERVEHIHSGLEGHVKFSGHGATTGPAEDQRDHKFNAHLTQYYDKVIAHLDDAETILVFGPGEAKGELKKEIHRKGNPKQLVTVETTDKLTDPQIIAKVRKYFMEHALSAG